MNLQTLATIFFTALVASANGKDTIDHDKVQPIPQPKPTTATEKAAVLFKPQLYTPPYVCVSYPAINADGGVTGGLKGSNGNDACKYAPKGSQVYGRAGQYEELWAFMYSWYFPKGFNWMGFPSRRHDWKSVVVWIDNPEVETPKIVGVSLSKSNTKYRKNTRVYASDFVGYQRVGRRYERTYIYGSNTSLRIEYMLDLGTYLTLGNWDGEYQDLIMWDQLTDGARDALNDEDNFGKAEVPFSDDNWEKHLENAYPL
ncbi:hypothetical protein PHMEG_00016072 [Phytophthora megakarya]|uniref:Necrosis inducing protein NPP1 n=1 Tax=Phytophthora megakarya TaxID=4795 RepID=A0A225VZV5_9STRA|nr:hypothetical protein PHMEG_00016072 [Phytophthora megakarya]